MVLTMNEAAGSHSDHQQGFDVQHKAAVLSSVLASRNRKSEAPGMCPFMKTFDKAPPSG